MCKFRQRSLQKAAKERITYGLLDRGLSTIYQIQRLLFVTNMFEKRHVEVPMTDLVAKIFI